MRQNPFRTTLIVFAIYVAWFLVQLLLPSNLTGSDETQGAATFVISQWSNQVGLIILLTALVAILVWWRLVGFKRHERGSLKLIIIPILYTVIYFGIAFVLNLGQGFLGAGSLTQFLSVVLVTMMVGYTEELMFRGFLFFGGVDRFREF